jgi:maltooligosyltrehalose trehalohydrolase
MIFMGQEWGASTPFPFFTDHNPALGEAIKAGRREEFSHFAAFREPLELDKLPNPQAVETFRASKLIWDERKNEPHASTLQLYKAAFALRSSHLAFRPLQRNSWTVTSLACGVGAIRLHSVECDWLVIFDLVGGHSGTLKGELLFEKIAGIWEIVFSTSDTRFGGDGTCGIDLVSMEARFPTPETVVLRAFPI